MDPQTGHPNLITHTTGFAVVDLETTGSATLTASWKLAWCCCAPTSPWSARGRH